MTSKLQSEFLMTIFSFETLDFDMLISKQSKQINSQYFSDKIQIFANETKLFHEYWIITIKRIDISLNTLRLAINFISADIV